MLQFQRFRPGWTIAREIYFDGIALMSGTYGRLRLLPQYDRLGLSMRVSQEGPWHAIDERSVVDTSGRTTTVQVGDVRVMLVEHIMSAIRGMGVDHLGIEISNSEVPIFDGSAYPFAKAIEESGLMQTDYEVAVYGLTESISVDLDGSYYVLSPVDEGCLLGRWHCVIDYPQSPAIGLQRVDFDFEKDSYIEQISRARTFCLLEELEAMRARGLIRGGTLDNGLVFDGNRPLNPEGCRYINEPVRHKLLDMIGDLGLLPFDVKMQLSAMRPGHRANNALAKILRSKLG